MVITWSCHVCGRERPDDRIAVYRRDLSGEFGLPPDSLRQNVRYCVDRASCTENARHVRFLAVSERTPRVSSVKWTPEQVRQMMPGPGRE